ncbi:MAG TPA: DUF2127 domain-containing protein [Phycisphaerae bacterium]|nr:DUF2127 domain-containing protein [Phycisphaerae bacterium]
MQPKKPILSIRHGEVKRHARWPLVLIGIGKLMKATALVVASFYLLKLINPQAHANLDTLLQEWREGPHNEYLYKALEKGLRIPPGKLKVLRVGALIYAGLYGIEGIGLLFDKGWAEWMTVITTAGFIPVEAYELWTAPTWPKFVLIIVNAAILLYLCVRLRWRGQVKRAAKHGGFEAMAGRRVTESPAAAR